MSAQNQRLSMFSNGTVIAHVAGGKIQPATEQQIAAHLASSLPREYKGARLSEVMFNPEDGCVYGKYGSKKVKKQLFDKTAQSPKESEPVDGTQKEVDVPRNKSKAKPETGGINKDRPDVANPTEVRTKDYKRGKGAEDLHSDEVVPRSKSDGGLKGGHVAPTAEEKADSATSGNPDSYVQKFTPSEKPAPAGSAKNHTAGTEIKLRPESEFYSRIALAEKEDEDAEAGAPDEAKDKSKDPEAKKKLPWEKEAGSEKENEQNSEAASFKRLYSEADKKLREQSAEISRYKIREARRASATEYTLAMAKLNPSKYASAEAFNACIEETASKMTVEAIKNAIESAGALMREAETMRQRTVTAAAEAHRAPADGEMSMVIVTDTKGPAPGMVLTAGSAKTKTTADELKEIMFSGSRLFSAFEEQPQPSN